MSGGAAAPPPPPPPAATPPRPRADPGPGAGPYVGGRVATAVSRSDCAERRARRVAVGSPIGTVCSAGAAGLFRGGWRVLELLLGAEQHVEHLRPQPLGGGERAAGGDPGEGDDLAETETLPLF